jgi:hypothetical protein
MGEDRLLHSIDIRHIERGDVIRIEVRVEEILADESISELMTRVERLEEEFTTTTAREHRKELGIGTIIEKKVRKARENKRKNSPFQMNFKFFWNQIPDYAGMTKYILHSK